MNYVEPTEGNPRRVKASSNVFDQMIEHWSVNSTANRACAYYLLEMQRGRVRQQDVYPLVRVDILLPAGIK